MNDTVYVNLKYNKQFQSRGVYAKLDIVGQVCVLVINKETPKQIIEGGRYVGLFGLDGAIVDGTSRSGKNWEDSDGKKNNILVINKYKRRI
jgi:hypothetical protein